MWLWKASGVSGKPLWPRTAASDRATRPRRVDPVRHGRQPGSPITRNTANRVPIPAFIPNLLFFKEQFHACLRARLVLAAPTHHHAAQRTTQVHTLHAMALIAYRLFDLPARLHPWLWLALPAAGALRVGTSGGLTTRHITRVPPMQSLRALN